MRTLYGLFFFHFLHLRTEIETADGGGHGAAVRVQAAEHRAAYEIIIHAFSAVPNMRTHRIQVNPRIFAAAIARAENV
jgi:hypothetical protein